MDAEKRTCSWSGCQNEVATKGPYCSVCVGAKRRRKARLIARLEFELLDPKPPATPDKGREKTWTRDEWKERLKQRLAEAKRVEVSA